MRGSGVRVKSEFEGLCRQAEQDGVFGRGERADAALQLFARGRAVAAGTQLHRARDGDMLQSTSLHALPVSLSGSAWVWSKGVVRAFGWVGAGVVCRRGAAAVGWCWEGGSGWCHGTTCTMTSRRTRVSHPRRRVKLTRNARPPTSTVRASTRKEATGSQRARRRCCWGTRCMAWRCRSWTRATG